MLVQDLSSAPEVFTSEAGGDWVVPLSEALTALTLDPSGSFRPLTEAERREKRNLAGKHLPPY